MSFVVVDDDPRAPARPAYERKRLESSGLKERSDNACSCSCWRIAMMSPWVVAENGFAFGTARESKLVKPLESMPMLDRKCVGTAKRPWCWWDCIEGEKNGEKYSVGLVDETGSIHRN